MTFPVGTIAAGTFSTAQNANWSVTMPAGVVAGDLLICAVEARTSNALTITMNAGWTRLAPTVGSNNWGAVFWAIAVGGDTALVSFGAGTSSSGATVFRITGHGHTALSGPEGAGFAATANPNGPSLTPSWGALDTMWIATGGQNTNASLTSYPTNYTLNQLYGQAGTTTSASTFSVCARNLNAATEDPGAWTLSSSNASTAFTVAVRPAALVGSLVWGSSFAAISHLLVR